MPVVRRTPSQETRDQLVEELIQEYRRGEQSPNREPLIVLEADENFGTEQVTVVWDKWQGVPSPVRESVIMDALRRVLAPLEYSRISLAWGLTQEQWKRRGASELGF